MNRIAKIATMIKVDIYLMIRYNFRKLDFFVAEQENLMPASLMV